MSIETSTSNKKRKQATSDSEQNHEAEDETSKLKKKSFPPNGYLCNLCQKPGHWIQQCPDRRKHNKQQQQQQQEKRKKNKTHVPVPGVDPSPKDIQAAKQYQIYFSKHKVPLCFCGNPSRLKKVKKNKNNNHSNGADKNLLSSRAMGKYFFFCATKREDNPCRFAKLAEDVMKEEKRKGDDRKNNHDQIRSETKKLEDAPSITVDPDDTPSKEEE